MEAAIETVVRKVLEEELHAFRQKLLTDIKLALDARLRAVRGPLAKAPSGTAPGADSAGEHNDDGVARGAHLDALDDAADRKRRWTEEMENELERLIHKQTNGDDGVTEDRISWQEIRALSTTMGHLSKDAIRKKGKRMLQSRSAREEAKKQRLQQPSGSIADPQARSTEPMPAILPKSSRKAIVTCNVRMELQNNRSGIFGG